MAGLDCVVCSAVPVTSTDSVESVVCCSSVACMPLSSNFIKSKFCDSGQLSSSDRLYSQFLSGDGRGESLRQEHRGSSRTPSSAMNLAG